MLLGHMLSMMCLIIFIGDFVQNYILCACGFTVQSGITRKVITKVTLSIHPFQNMVSAVEDMFCVFCIYYRNKRHIRVFYDGFKLPKG